MQLRGFSLSNRFTLAEDVPLNVVTELKERGVTLPGMDIVEEALRSVAQGDVVPHEIGTVGPIYAEEYEKLKSEGYALDDTVGKSGYRTCHGKHAPRYRRYQGDHRGKRCSGFLGYENTGWKPEKPYS